VLGVSFGSQAILQLLHNIMESFKARVEVHSLVILMLFIELSEVGHTSIAESQLDFDALKKIGNAEKEQNQT
jgi:hypothetical protein